MKEAGVVIDKNGRAIHWHVPAQRTTGALPDSRLLWEVLWSNRETVAGFAHIHPGSGIPGPSYTDVTTFDAIESALGRRLDWWIASADAIVLVRWVGPERLAYNVGRSPQGPAARINGGPVLLPEPEWTAELRRLSNPKENES
jgi:hypothetical protein